MRLKTSAFVVMAIALMLVVSGCFGSKTKVKTETDVNPPAPEPSPENEPGVVVGTDVNVGTTTGVTLYDYGRLREYEYKITTTASGQTNVANFKYSVNPGTYLGQNVFVITTDFASEGATGKVSMYMTKETGKCIIAQTEITVLDQVIKNEAKCDVSNDIKTNTEGKAEVRVAGTETVTVPAGTFTATKYTVENGASYWVASNVPIPVKFEASASGSTTVGELVGYG